MSNTRIAVNVALTGAVVALYRLVRGKWWGKRKKPYRPKYMEKNKGIWRWRK